MLERLVDQLLDLLLGLQIDSCSGLVQDDYLALPENRSADTDESLLTGAHVATTTLDLEFKEIVIFLLLGI